MQRYALLGWPVKHSVSPAMQGAGFAALGIAATYELRPVPPEGLAEAVSGLRRDGFCGWNITVPHKEAMPGLIDEVDPEAAAAGSVNTVVNRDGRLCGYSTDGYGLAEAVRESFGIGIAGRKVLFLGTGGATRACSVYFGLRGVAELVLVNRTLSRAEAVAAAVRRAAPAATVRCVGLDASDAVRDELRGTDVLIQSTSLGLHADDPTPLAPAILPPGLAVMDMIYRATPFLRAAAVRGCRTADGRGMLLHQGARSLAIWTGRQPPVESMRQALYTALP